MASMKAELREDIAAQGREMAARVLEVRLELGDQMRLLHEDLVERIGRINRG